MGLFCHMLKGNRSVAFPRNTCYVDTEASIAGVDGGGEIHTLRLGVACYERDGFGRHKSWEEWLSFGDAGVFWRWVIAQSERDRTLLVLAYNMGYDFRLLDGFRVLESLGYEQKSVYVKSGTLIIRFRRGKHKLMILDVGNFVRGSLEDWGRRLGLAKIPVDFRAAAAADLDRHCHRDVEIMRRLWHRWRDFVVEKDLGAFAVTRAAQAMRAFRHRFMGHAIYIHDNPTATEIERTAYVGGRVECWHIGKVPGGPFAKLDVNSMYPYVMTQTPVPVRLRAIRHRPALRDVQRWIDRYGIIADVGIETDTPIYPTTHAGRRVWPIGSFRTCLCEPELRAALGCGHVRQVYRACIYDRAVIFARYVEELYVMRRTLEREGNILWADMVKLMLNSLYGKFGQRSEDWVYVGAGGKGSDGMHVWFDADTGERYVTYTIAGHTWRVTQAGESYNSFAGIAATITSAARMYLWTIIQQAGISHVYYMDTDSVVVDSIGLANLAEFRDDYILGKLKMEYMTDSLCLYAPKDYKTDRDRKHKGIPKGAIRDAGGTWRYTQWQGLRGAMHDGELDRVLLRPAVKRPSGQYEKGYVSSSGDVSPIVMRDSSC
jgi:hypothetical protein